MDDRLLCAKNLTAQQKADTMHAHQNTSTAMHFVELAGTRRKAGNYLLIYVSFYFVFG